MSKLMSLTMAGIMAASLFTAGCTADADKRAGFAVSAVGALAVLLVYGSAA